MNLVDELFHPRVDLEVLGHVGGQKGHIWLYPLDTFSFHGRINIFQYRRGLVIQCHSSVTFREKPPRFVVYDVAFQEFFEDHRIRYDIFIG